MLIPKPQSSSGVFLTYIDSFCSQLAVGRFSFSLPGRTLLVLNYACCLLFAVCSGSYPPMLHGEAWDSSC